MRTPSPRLCCGSFVSQRVRGRALLGLGSGLVFGLAFGFGFGLGFGFGFGLCCGSFVS
jgi:hypothetical protein